MANLETVYFAGGCFWGTQKFFSSLNGVVSTEVGFANGDSEQVSYKEVCTGETAHAEVVKVTFDPQIVAFVDLVHCFLATIDPTSLNKQGGDVGTQYRTGIYFPHELVNKYQPIVQKILQQEQSKYKQPIVVENLVLRNYCSAENYHQDYLSKNPTGYCHLDFDKLSEIIARQNTNSKK